MKRWRAKLVWTRSHNPSTVQEALAFLAHDGGQREIYCAVGTRYLTRDSIEKPTDEAVRPALFHPGDAFAPPFRGGFFVDLSASGVYRRELRALCASLPCGVKIYPHEKSRSAMFFADRLFDLLGILSAPRFRSVLSHWIYHCDLTPDRYQRSPARPLDLARLLGHSSPKTTMIYNNPKFSLLREQMRIASGLPQEEG